MLEGEERRLGMEVEEVGWWVWEVVVEGTVRGEYAIRRWQRVKRG